MGVIKIIMVTLIMMMMLVGTIRETKATSATYWACVKHCKDEFCSSKPGDKNCFPNCIFYNCGSTPPRNIRNAKGEGST
ncbi:unnamed protein product [Eruca vesicaria subsp. sativa]|uniref:Plant thionin family protein n=1 Tax=Eruca vesicaria subsp. sativa TaxID=29727 RepID=A0ABC8JJ62_ERUVS|nr:unnamed protein product [Eruca vesicaria subsp. sativa]